MKIEYWRPIRGYEGIYEVSNLGRVKSLARVIRRSNGRVHHTVPERILKAKVKSGGYLFVGLCKEGKVKWCTVHRLVAQAFIENPNNLPEVNHRDENKTNNRVENLEWISHKDNCNFGTRNDRIAAGNSVVLRNRTDQSKQVAQIDRTTGEVVRIWPSTKEVTRQLGYSHGNLSKCALDKPHYNTAYGFKWRYVN